MSHILIPANKIGRKSSPAELGLELCIWGGIGYISHAWAQGIMHRPVYHAPHIGLLVAAGWYKYMRNKRATAGYFIHNWENKMLDRLAWERDVIVKRREILEQQKEQE